MVCKDHGNQSVLETLILFGFLFIEKRCFVKNGPKLLSPSTLLFLVGHWTCGAGLHPLRSGSVPNLNMLRQGEDDSDAAGGGENLAVEEVRPSLILLEATEDHTEPHSPTLLSFTLFLSLFKYRQAAQVTGSRPPKASRFHQGSGSSKNLAPPSPLPEATAAL